MCHAIPFSARALKKKTSFLLVDVLVRKNKTDPMWFNVVCTLTINDKRHHSGQNLLWNHLTAPREATTF